MDSSSGSGSGFSSRTLSGDNGGLARQGAKAQNRRPSPTTPADMTHKQARDLQNVFKLLDKDSNGSITKRRLAMLLAELDDDIDLFGLRDVLNTVDVDGDGNIDIKNFLSMMSGTSDGIDSDESMRSAFKIFDRHEHGYISGEDLQRVMGSIGDDVTAEEAKRMIHGADQTGDGMLDLKGFTAMMKK